MENYFLFPGDIPLKMFLISSKCNISNVYFSRVGACSFLKSVYAIPFPANVKKVAGSWKGCSQVWGGEETTDHIEMQLKKICKRWLYLLEMQDPICRYNMDLKGYYLNTQYLKFKHYKNILSNTCIALNKNIHKVWACC